jgi:hypothetical protein
MAFNMSQFKLTNIAGVVMNPAANVIQAQVLSTYGTATYVSAGQVVAFGTATGDIPTVRAVNTGFGVGIIVANAKRDKFYGNMVVGVAIDGSVITCNAGAAIMRGDVVGYGSTTNNLPNVTTMGSGNGIGIALDIASAAGDIIRVLVRPGVAYNVTQY